MEPQEDRSGCGRIIGELRSVADQMAAQRAKVAPDFVNGMAQLPHQQRFNSLTSRLGDLLWARQSKERWETANAELLMLCVALESEGEEVPCSDPRGHDYFAAEDELGQTCRRCGETA